VEKTGAPGERPLDCWARFRVGHKPCLVGRVGRHVALGDGVWLVTRRTLEIADGVAMTSPGSGLVSARLAEASQSAGGFPPPMFRQDVVTFLMAMSRLASMLATRVSICPKRRPGTPAVSTLDTNQAPRRQHRDANLHIGCHTRWVHRPRRHERRNRGHRGLRCGSARSFLVADAAPMLAHTGRRQPPPGMPGDNRTRDAGPPDVPWYAPGLLGTNGRRAAGVFLDRARQRVHAKPEHASWDGGLGAGHH
jgi:hypothetical protein